MVVGLSLIAGLATGFLIKQCINYLSINGYKVDNKSLFLEMLCGFIWVWAINSLNIQNALVFAGISSILIGIGFVDLNTFQIPFAFVIAGVLIVLIALLGEVIPISSFLWGIFVGAVIPLIIMGGMWMITKRQGMGFGDIQLGFVLGAWLGPMRMALTLFTASVLSLTMWIAVSFMKGFDKDRALPFAPFLAVSGIGVYVGSVYYPGIFHLLILN